jgi:hypothetical protein
MDSVFKFGKHKSDIVKHVLRFDAEYIIWAIYSRACEFTPDVVEAAHKATAYESDGQDGGFYDLQDYDFSDQPF